MNQLALIEDPIEVAFIEFHHQNPQVYDSLITLAERWKTAGHSKVGIKMLFEVLRWEHGLSGVKDSDGFKLNNNYTSRYARLIMANNPHLSDLFDVRRLHDDEIAA